MSNTRKTILILALVCLLIAVIPLVFIRGSEFEGADAIAEEAIGEINPDYEPWFEPVLEPPGGETESLLFCIQAAIGAGFLGYAFGHLRTKAKYSAEKE